MRGTKSYSKILPGLLIAVCIVIMISCTALQKETGNNKSGKESSSKEAAGADNKAVQAGDVIAKKIDKLTELPYGMWVTGYFNDYLLKNNKIMVVIGALDKKLENMPSGGHILDIARVEDPLDQIGQISMKYGDNLPPAYTYTDIQIKTSGYPNNGAAIVVSGKDTTRDILIQTEYIIEPDSSYIKIVTSIENKTNEAITGLNCGDHANFGALGLFIEGKGAPSSPDKEITTESNWIGAQRDNFSIGFAQQLGTLKSKCVNSIAEISEAQLNIQPNQKINFERYVIVSDKSLSPISDMVYSKIKNLPVGAITGKVVEQETKEGVGGVDVQISLMGEGQDKGIKGPFTRIYSAEKGIVGSFSVKVPVGKYVVRTRPFARQRPQTTFSLTVKQNETAVTELGVSKENKCKLNIIDADTRQPIPCKLTFQATPPTQPVDFGFPKDAKSRNVFYSATGQEELPIPAGDFRVIVSRGPEYEMVEKDFKFEYGKENKIDVEIKRIVDTKGMISVDMGLKTNASPGCPVSAQDRILQAVGEGVEIGISADTNKATDLEPLTKQMGLDKWFKTIIGKRLVYTDLEHYAELTTFPVAKEDASSMSASDQYKGKTYADIFKDIRAKYPNALLMVNRVIFPGIGYFTSNGYDADTKDRLISLPEIPLDFDIYELWEGKKGGTKAVTDSIQLYFNLLMKGKKPTLTASSNSYFTFGEEVGYPRVYVESSEDDPAKANLAEVIDNLKKGKTLVTNGPIIKFTVNGKGAGELVTATDGKLQCSLEIFAAPWVDTSFIDINKDGIFSKRIYQGPSDKVQRYPKEGSSNKKEFTVETKRDVILNVSLGGKKSLDPVVAPLFYGEGGGIVPFAMTGPIFIDFDGNGKYDPPSSSDTVGN